MIIHKQTSEKLQPMVTKQKMCMKPAENYVQTVLLNPQVGSLAHVFRLWLKSHGQNLESPWQITVHWIQKHCLGDYIDVNKLTPNLPTSLDLKPDVTQIQHRKNFRI